jgi:ribose transport system substrate-binding protein
MRSDRCRKPRGVIGRFLLAIALVGVLGVVVGCGSNGETGGGSDAGASSSTSASTTAVKTIGGITCGEDVKLDVPDPDGVLAKLPAATRAGYDNWPYQVKASPWANFKGKKPPWKIGLVYVPPTTQYSVDLIKQLEDEFNAAKAKGLVTGKLEKYIQQSYDTATPEQQIAAIQQMVRNGVDGIIINPIAGPPLVPAIDAAGKAGVPVVVSFNVVDQSKYAINNWAQNNSPAVAGVLKQAPKGNVLIVRGIPGIPVEQAYQDAAERIIKACPDAKVVGTVWGQYSNATAKAEVSKWLASHPGVKVDAVVQNGTMMAGVIQAFEQAGRTVPPISGGGCQGGELSWWLKHQADYKTTAMCLNGYQTAWTEFRLLERVLDGRGLKVNAVSTPVPLVTNENLAQYATPDKPLNWPGESRGDIQAWANDKTLDAFFNKPGTPGN